MKSPSLLAIFLIIGFLGCSDRGASPVDNQSPTRFPLSFSFKYTAFDDQGSVTATGTLTLVIDNSRVTGAWSLDDGRQGTLAGTSEHGTVQIDLYPGYQDHNFVLTGRFSGSTFSGEWVLYGWATIGRGSFLATLKVGVVPD